MKWQVAFDSVAEKQFSKLGKPAQQNVEKYITKHLELMKTRDVSANPSLEYGA